MNIIPKPTKVLKGQGEVQIKSADKVWIDDNFISMKELISYILPEVKQDNITSNHQQDEVLLLCMDQSMTQEAYKIVATQGKVTITAADQSGIIYGLETLKQLNTSNDLQQLTIPCVTIEDTPRFKFRGLSLDEARYFWGKDFCKRLLDLMAFYKLNRFHWHLSDDAGWRIEIKQYPLLTQIGSKRKNSNIHGWKSADMVGEPYGGFYTQEDIKEIVAYAAERGITVIPEIDMPAHFAAAMASYNWLGCREIPCETHWFFGGHVPELMGWKDWNRSACPGKETTFQFIFNVIDELAQLFPVPYFHIGGDEAPKEEWETCPHCKKRMEEEHIDNVEDLQGYFNNRIAKYLKAKGKNLIVWNEALAADNLNTDVIGQYWTLNDDANVLKHIEKGGQVIISKHSAFYFDMCYCEYPVSNTYNFEPVGDMVPEKYENQILGLEGELWTEWIADEEKAFMQLFPRVPALAEIAWCPKGNKDFNDFMNRWQTHKPYLDQLGVNYAEDSIAMPEDETFRKQEVEHWYNDNQYREVERNRALK